MAHTSPFAAPARPTPFRYEAPVVVIGLRERQEPEALVPLAVRPGAVYAPGTAEQKDHATKNPGRLTRRCNRRQPPHHYRAPPSGSRGGETKPCDEDAHVGALPTSSSGIRTLQCRRCAPASVTNCSWERVRWRRAVLGRHETLRRRIERDTNHSTPRLGTASTREEPHADVR